MNQSKKIKEVKGNEFLLRRVPFYCPPQYIKPDGKVTSLAFKPRKVDKDGLSVDIQRLTSFEKAILDKNKFRLFGFLAEVPMSLCLDVIHAPEENNFAHALIKGYEKLTNSGVKKLASIMAKKAIPVSMWKN